MRLVPVPTVEPRFRGSAVLAAAGAAPAAGAIDWQACGADFPGIDCATTAVPLDYDRPGGATTEIALAPFLTAPTTSPANGSHAVGSLPDWMLVPEP